MIRIVLLAAAATLALAQSQTDAFGLIRILQAPSGPVVNPGIIQMHRNARVPVNVLGLKSVSGPQQVWLLEAQGSFAGLEAADKALAALPPSPDQEAMLASVAMIGLLRPGLSYRPDEAMKAIPAARYFQVTFFRTRPGASMEFAELMRLRNAALDQINLDRPEMGYQIISGAPSGTYVFLAPLQSLRSIDDAMARTIGNADSGHPTRQAASKISADGEITRDQFLFRVDPRISSVSEAFAAGAPDFWSGRE